MTCHNPTEAMTTILLAEGDNAHWHVTPMPEGKAMLTSCDANVSIVGTPRQLATMFRRQSVALAEYVTEPTTEFAEEKINVN